MNIKTFSLTNQFWLFVFVIILLAVFPLFYNLNYLPIRLFDESRLAVNALEMSRNNNFLVTHFDGLPDMWNVKPPLMIWCQVASLHLFGTDEFALRFPAAMAGLLTILAVFYFVKKSGGHPLFAFASSAVLIATPGFITEHGTRSGDYDAMLVLFQVCYAWSYFLWLKFPGKMKYLTLTFICLLLAVFTKGIAGLMLLPGLLIFTIYSKQLSSVIQERKFWIGTVITIAFVASFYLLREVLYPGYLKKVFENEIFYRYFDVNEGHEGKWNFYLKYLTNSGYSGWYLLALAGLLTLFITRDILFKKLVAFAGIVSISFLVIISSSQTKIEWYALPLFPFLAILGSSLVWFLFNELPLKLNVQKLLLKSGVIVLFLILFAQNYAVVVRNSIQPKEIPGEEDIYRLSYVFQSALNGKENLDGLYYCYLSYNAHLQFYTEVLKEKSQEIIFREPLSLKPGNKVLVGTPDVNEIIVSNYKFQVLKTWNNGAQLLLILE